MSSEEASHRMLVAGLAALAPIVVRGREYTGAYLAMLVAINPEQPVTESARTPQLIVEVGRLVAAAQRDKEMIEAEHRIWRETMIRDIMGDPGKAAAAGFTGKISKTAVDEWVHTLPQYRDYQERIATATEAWTVLHHTLEAARARSRTVWTYEQQGGGAAPRVASPRPAPREDSDNRYHTGSAPDQAAPLYGSVEEILAAPSTPMPPRAPVVPPPPGRPPRSG